MTQVLILIQTVLHSDNDLEKLILKTVSRRQQKHEKLPSMQIFDKLYFNLQGPPVDEEAQESARSKWGGGGAELRLAEKSLEESEESARPKWGGGGAELRLAEKSLEEPEDSARSKWGAGVNLRQMSLEETASQMEGES